MRRLIRAVVLVAAVAVRDANAQAVTPAVELGFDAAATITSDRSPHWGPRLVVHFNGRDALQITATLQRLSPLEDFAQVDNDLYLAAYRRLLHTAGPVRIFGTIGGGLERTLIVTPAITFGNPPVTFPSTRGTQVLPAFTTGAGVDLRLGSRAAVVLESSFVLSDTFGGRVSAGLVVPLRAYPPRTAPLASSVPWAKLDAGARAWVTTADGREVDGEVIGRSAATLTLRTPSGTVLFTTDNVRAIDTTDSIRNGTVLGTIIGSLAMVFPAIAGSYLVCVEENCGAVDVVYISSVLIGMGAGIGAATGALVDSLRERRVPVYRRGGSGGVTLAPIAGSHTLGGRAIIRW